jgi:hypothetical protein
VSDETGAGDHPGAKGPDEEVGHLQADEEPEPEPDGGGGAGGHPNLRAEEGDTGTPGASGAGGHGPT